MRKTLALLVASTALTATIGLPAWSAMNAPADMAAQPFTAVLADGSQPLPLVLVSDDDDDDDHGKRDSVKRGHDDMTTMTMTTIMTTTMMMTTTTAAAVRAIPHPQARSHRPPTDCSATAPLPRFR